MESFETQRLLIRELQMSDAMRLSEYRNKKEVAFYQSWWHYPYNKDMLIQVICLIVGFVLLIKGADVFVEGHLNYHQK